ncbi:hypothetical protein [Aliidiomarina soli]|uniref:Uncharacterized protein n=1 Tax=Aliidiomarina soli TaxID=1928574 RepID=A0A432WHN1_9GAMM|nr:hypothetical protein [Aliidiomarina soli]RUO33179.1 hypothetical protein CWE14_08115 [Aliidiomarina soli]
MKKSNFVVFLIKNFLISFGLIELLFAMNVLLDWSYTIENSVQEVVGKLFFASIMGVGFTVRDVLSRRKCKENISV